MSGHDGLLGAFATTRPALLRFLILRGASQADAEDVLQEMYLKLAAGGIGPVAETRAYLYRMATNLLLGIRRTADRRVRREEDWVGAFGGAEGEIDERPSAEAGLIARDQVALLQELIDGLPDRTRSIFRRFRVEGEAQRSIAADLGISVSAVEKHLARAYEAITAIRPLLDGEEVDQRRLRTERGRNGH